VRSWWRRRRAVRGLRDQAPVGSLLVLCTANLVRSPFAQKVLEARLGDRVLVRSRGVLPGGGNPPPEAMEVAAELGFSLEGHVAQRLQPSELVSGNIVFVMEGRMATVLGGQYPAIRERLFLLGRFDSESGWGEDIDDPYMLTRNDYFTAYERILRCCDAVVEQLSDTWGGTA